MLGHIASLILVFYSISFVIWTYRKTHNTDNLIILEGFIGNLIFSIHDWLQGMYSEQHQAIYLLPFGAPLLLITVAWMFVQHFIRLQRNTVMFNQHLSQEIKEVSEQLNAKHESMQKMENERILSQERERIMQDLHDGMGGQLISALAQVRQADSSQAQALLQQTLSDALLDLRLVIDSLDEDTRNLPTLLAMLRMRLEPQMKSANIQLHWKIQDAEVLSKLGHEVSLNLLRIVQEALTNAIRHARCSEITVFSQFIQPNIRIQVSDNGQGIGDAKAGRGTGNMRRRAAKVGAELNTDSSTAGTTVSVEMTT